MNSPILQPEQHVLSTLEADGSRRWLKPKVSTGRWLRWRRVLAYVLIAIFTLFPFIKVAGKPIILLDVARRQFTIFGFTFLPTDTVLLAIFMIGLLLAVFLFTALFGRVWCGWACPQTVYMEFLFRPIERLFDGTTGRGGVPRKRSSWGTGGKYAVYFLLCIYLANTFLAYFVGVEKLGHWIRQSPLEHPVPFMVMAVVTIAMMVDFCFFREQLCVIACPYGRFQSVLLDQNSLIVAYDLTRGEPRGRISKLKANHTAIKDELPVLGDCIDCGNCVTTCPTGIDIRAGLQMECINCTQCIDACNLVMQKIGRAPNLIRYSSQNRDQGLATGLIRLRTILYPLLLCVIITAFFAVFLNQGTFEVVMLREPGNPYSVNREGVVQNLIRVKITNRSDRLMQFTAVPTAPDNASLEFRESTSAVPPGETNIFHASIVVPPDAFRNGRATLRLNISNQLDELQTLELKLVGPYR